MKFDFSGMITQYIRINVEIVRNNAYRIIKKQKKIYHLIFFISGRLFEHEGIVKFLDLFLPPDTIPSTVSDLYIVSELMDTDLYRIINSSQVCLLGGAMFCFIFTFLCSIFHIQVLSGEHVQYFVYQILRALKYMHSARVMHRDLKPSNVLVDSNCEIKLCDFGLSRGLLREQGSDGDGIEDGALTS